MSDSATCSSNQAILDVLLARWSQASGQRATAAEDPRFHMWQARHTIKLDLMVRTRGTAIAVLRMHGLYRLLQPHISR